MATRRLFGPRFTRDEEAAGRSPRSWLVDGCCLGTAVAGLVLSLGLGRCEQGRAGPTVMSTLAPIMQTRGHRFPTGCATRAARRSQTSTQ